MRSKRVGKGEKGEGGNWGVGRETGSRGDGEEWFLLGF